MENRRNISYDNLLSLEGEWTDESSESEVDERCQSEPDLVRLNSSSTLALQKHFSSERIKETGSSHGKKLSGRPFVNDELVRDIRNKFIHRSKKSVWNCACELRLSKTTILSAQVITCKDTVDIVNEIDNYATFLSCNFQW